MIVYPVIIATLCRFEHFKKCVDSLSKCTLANQTELVIGLDYPLKESHRFGYDKIVSYIDNISGFKTVTILKTDVNIGASQNFKRLYEYAYSKYDAVIMTEDDNIFSPCFLEFMNKALNKYKNEDKVLSVSGYTALTYYNRSKNRLILTYDVSAWGTGYWKHKSDVYFNKNRSYYISIVSNFRSMLKIYMVYPRLLSMLLYMLKNNLRWGDTEKTTYNIINHAFQLRPSMSYVRNIGQDGSGLHSGMDNDIMNQEISCEDHFYFAESDSIVNLLSEFKITQKGSFTLGMPKSKMRFVASLVKIFIEWCIYKFSFNCRNRNIK